MPVHRACPEPGEGVEAGLEEQEAVIPPDTPSAEDVPPMEEPPQGEERPERRGETPISPPTPEKNRSLERSGLEDAKVTGVTRCGFLLARCWA